MKKLIVALAVSALCAPMIAQAEEKHHYCSSIDDKSTPEVVRNNDEPETMIATLEASSRYGIRKVLKIIPDKIITSKNNGSTGEYAFYHKKNRTMIANIGNTPSKSPSYEYGWYKLYSYVTGS